MSERELDRLQRVHFAARTEFENACRQKKISKEAFDKIRERSMAAAKEYHDCLAREWHVR